MDALPDAVVAATLEYCDIRTLKAVESANRHLHHLVQAQDIWARLARLHVVLSDDGAPTTSVEWKRLVHVVAQPFDVSTASALLQDVAACSSVDREEESPDNTLRPSPCWQAIQTFPEWARATEDIFTSLATRVQYQCNCTHGFGCYWSSSHSTDPAAEDFIEYTMASQSIVRALQVVPYRAFWHPQEPAYAPRAVSFQFYAVHSGTTTKKELVHESPVFPIENKMQLNGFLLEQPVWLPNGGIMRLKMHGRHQVQTVEMPTGPQGNVPYYYTCLSYVGAQGVSSVRVHPTPNRDQDQTQRASHADINCRALKH